METQTIDSDLMLRMFIAGVKRLESCKDVINELNVFPVPDGDTGTNMSMTVTSALEEVRKTENPNIEELAKAISSGSLRGARGNSGVILSQLFRGFSKVVRHYEQLDKAVISEAANKAVETAYKAVMKPKEGTILTVAKEAAAKAEALAQDAECSMSDYICAIADEAQNTLQKTKEMLPVLKQAGVVDSGGQGLVEMLVGARDAFLGRESDYDYIAETAVDSMDAAVGRETEYGGEDIRYGYCTEFIIRLSAPLEQGEEESYRHFLDSIGDSIVLVVDDEMVKTHVHSNEPGTVLQKALSYGSLSNIKIDNMREEHREKLIKDSERLAAEQRDADGQVIKESEAGFICVSMGEGIRKAFAELGTDYIIEGGQTMNPSTEDILLAIERVHARHIFLFPNNKNIILAAGQAAEMTGDKQVHVIPTISIPQGITALTNYVAEQSCEDNISTMLEVIETVRTGEVTYAVRDTTVADKEIAEGDYMGIAGGSILEVGSDREKVAKALAEQLLDDDSALICIYYGADVSEKEAEALGSDIRETHPAVEVEVLSGGQPVYAYILSVE